MFQLCTRDTQMLALFHEAGPNSFIRVSLDARYAHREIPKVKHKQINSPMPVTMESLQHMERHI